MHLEARLHRNSERLEHTHTHQYNITREKETMDYSLLIF